MTAVSGSGYPTYGAGTDYGGAIFEYLYSTRYGTDVRCRTSSIGTVMHRVVPILVLPYCTRTCEILYHILCVVASVPYEYSYRVSMLQEYSAVSIPYRYGSMHHKPLDS